MRRFGQFEQCGWLTQLMNMLKTVELIRSVKHFSLDVLVTTPNRLVHMLQQDPPAVSLEGVEWLIFDEADKLFEEGKDGFRDQVGLIQFKNDP